ncbi:MAG: dihydroorotate dehydrogenase electron transfer subunit [Methanomassiliicoccus sp.]|nr:dihydroorotate dehydrogenase electron transfer subunit [Methanomassiliicoccus sp.]
MLIETRVRERIEAGKGITTLVFDAPMEARPGQFVMVWVPGVDEVPMSLSHIGPHAGITVKEVGEATKALSCLRPGDVIGIRGPYGNGWRLSGGRILCVGGGVGMAPIITAVEAAGDPGRVAVAIGARNHGEIIFEERARSVSNDVRITTDDGSYGLKGTVVSLADTMMKEKRYDLVLGCGPEVMNKFLLKACKDNEVPCQLSLERLMKCGAGLCGSCVIDGLRVCADGPVFTGEQVERMAEFGKCKRDDAGLRVKL